MFLVFLTKNCMLRFSTVYYQALICIRSDINYIVHVRPFAFQKFISCTTNAVMYIWFTISYRISLSLLSLSLSFSYSNHLCTHILLYVYFVRFAMSVYRLTNVLYGSLFVTAFKIYNIWHIHLSCLYVCVFICSYSLFACF